MKFRRCQIWMMGVLLVLQRLSLLAQSTNEPLHPILTISGSGSGASTVTNIAESYYTNSFIPHGPPRNNGYGFVSAVVSGDTGWSWSSSTPNQIKSTPSGIIFPNANPAYPVQTQAVTVFLTTATNNLTKTVNAVYYNKAGSTTSKSLVFNLIDYNKLNQLRSDLNKLSPAYINSGNTPATRNDNYARRIAIALLDWARWHPSYYLTAINSASFINVTPNYLATTTGFGPQRASDHNGLAHEWQDDELLAFDAIYNSVALTNMNAEFGFDVRQYICDNLFFDEGDFLINHIPVDIAIQSNLSGPYAVLPQVARVLNRPDYILWMDAYLDATVRQKIRRDGALEEGEGYSIGYLNSNQDAAQNTHDYFLTRAATNSLLLAISNRATIYNNTFTYGQGQWSTISLPSGQLPAFGDTPYNNYFSSHSAGNSALLPAYGTLAIGAGSGSQAVQVNQNFSGDNNHMRADMAAFVLWAFNNPYLDNIRYYNGAIGRNFGEQMLAYNTIEIDRSNLTPYPDADTYGNGDLTLYEPGNNGLAMTEIDGQRAYSGKASRFQRLLLLNIVDLAKPYVVDVFRVTGGTTHDYLFHGAMLWNQNSECSFPLVTNKNLYPMLESGDAAWSLATDTPYYGFWRNVSSNAAPGNFQITYTDANRTTGRDVKLWMTADPNVYNIYLGTTPVPARDNTVPTNFFNAAGLVRPSAIIRHRISSGTLQDLFVSVIEPFNTGVSNIVSVQRLPMSGSSLESCGLQITFKDGRVDTYIINLQNPKITGANIGSATVSTLDGQYSLTGRVGLYSTNSAGASAWVVNGSHFQCPGGLYSPTNLYYSGWIAGSTRKYDGAAYDAFTTTTPLPTGTALRNKYLSFTHGTMSGTGVTNISEMFKIDQVVLSNGLYCICFTNDQFLEITNGTTSVEQVAPLRTFTTSNSFEIALSGWSPASVSAVPTGLKAVAGNGQVFLTWNPPFGATGYNVKRATVNGGPYTTIASPATAYFTDTNVTNGRAYFYIVSAANLVGESSDSAQVSATPYNLASVNLVAHLTFDDNTASDSSGYGNNGVLNGGASIVTDAQRGKVLSLDGSSGYVDLGNDASLNLSGSSQATIATWVKVAVTHNHNTILSKGEWNEAYSLMVKGDTSPPNLLWTGNDTSVFSADPVPLNTWTHVAVTINGSLTSFYINGQLNGATNQDRGNPIDQTSTDVCIGREQYSGSMPAGRWFFNGEMADVRIYNKALTQFEIQSAMSNVVDTAPAFASHPLAGPAANAGQPYTGSLAGNASDPDPGDTGTLVFSKINGPDWLQVAGNGSLSGMPLADDAGTNNFGVRVTDSTGFFDETTLNIIVIPAPPHITGAALSGGSLVFDGTNGVPGWQYLVLSSTNMVLPLSAWAHLATNYFDAAGGFIFTDNVPPSASVQFYRLMLP